MNKSIIFLIFAGMLLFNQVSGQANKQRFNYSEGVVTLKNGTVLQGQVANIKHGFRDKLLDHVRIKPWGRIFAKKYSPRKVDRFTMGDREFVS